MSTGYWFAPETDETSFLAGWELGEKVSVTARIARSLFRNEENGYSVYDVEDVNNRWFKINGYFPAPLVIDGYYEVEGVVAESKHGLVLRVTEFQSAFPRDEVGVVTVLRTLPRLNAVAPSIYRQLGPDALDLILNAPETVVQRCKGVTLPLAVLWQEALRSARERDATLRFLQEYQIPAPAIKELMEKYPDLTGRLKQSPYFLIDEVKGLGFAKCDEIALKKGYPLSGPERLEYAMLDILNRHCLRSGNCFMDYELFMEKVGESVNIAIPFKEAAAALENDCVMTLFGQSVTLDKASLQAAVRQFQAASARPGIMSRRGFTYIYEVAPKYVLASSLRSLCEKKRVKVDGDRVYSWGLYQAEVSVAKSLRAMVASEYGSFPDVEQVLDNICAADNVTLEKKQREAVLRFCCARGGVFVLTGRAGCGKTFVLNIIIRVLRELYRRQELTFSAQVMAPTGKAAQVAHKSTGLPAQTVHRALGMTAGQLDSDAVIRSECVVVDEFSMMGVVMASVLLRSIAPGSKVIIMGDYEQLPSIEAGYVLHDIIHSQVIPVVTLDVVKRQSEGSGILLNANQILDGHMIRSAVVNKQGLANNAYIYKTEQTLECRNRMLEKFQYFLSRGYSVDDVQVLCPQKGTELGIDAMNYHLQQLVNPAHGGLEAFCRSLELWDNNGVAQSVQLCLREGDKVINTSNDYKKAFYKFKKGEGFVEDPLRVGIVNGEMGRVARIVDVRVGSSVHRRVYVLFGNPTDGNYAMYEDEWGDLSLAYAMTIHRSQGSQWPVVMAPIMSINRNMLSRNVFYTLYTRAESVSLVFGTSEAIQHAINNVSDTTRNTGLIARLREGC